jgi:hypothetical protein
VLILSDLLYAYVPLLSVKVVWLLAGGPTALPITTDGSSLAECLAGGGGATVADRISDAHQHLDLALSAALHRCGEASRYRLLSTPLCERNLMYCVGREQFSARPIDAVDLGLLAPMRSANSGPFCLSDCDASDIRWGCPCFPARPVWLKTTPEIHAGDDDCSTVIEPAGVACRGWVSSVAFRQFSTTFA